MKGASASLASRRAISVLPTPVGPIIRMFLGVISWRSFSSTCCRRQRLRSAMATARLASFWPTMWRSSSETISWGVIELIGLPPPGSALRAAPPPSASGGGERLRAAVRRSCLAPLPREQAVGLPQQDHDHQAVHDEGAHLGDVVLAGHV